MFKVQGMYLYIVRSYRLTFFLPRRSQPSLPPLFYDRLTKKISKFFILLRHLLEQTCFIYVKAKSFQAKPGNQLID